jgi:hypothetical protein
MDVPASDPASCKQPSQEDHSCYVSTPAINDASVPPPASHSMTDHAMQEIPQPQPAVLHRSTADLFPALQLHHNESGYSILTSNSEVSILPMYTPPTPSADAMIRPMSRNEVDMLRTRYEEHHAQYLRHRKTYVIILVIIMQRQGIKIQWKEKYH